MFHGSVPCDVQQQKSTCEWSSAEYLQSAPCSPGCRMTAPGELESPSSHKLPAINVRGSVESGAWPPLLCAAPHAGATREAPWPG